MAAVYKKEVRSYFTSMIGCVFIAFALVIIGLYFFANNLYSGYPYFGYSLSASFFVFLILIPVLTMRSMAEDRKQKTDQMLLTNPISTWSVIISKYLAMLTVFAVVIAVICLYPLIMAAYGTISFSMAYTSILGFALMGCMAIAIGLFVSSITESQVISAVITFLILFVLYMAEAISDLIPTSSWINLVAFMILMVAISALIDYLTDNSLVSGIVGVAGIVILAVAYLMDSGTFEGAFGDLIASLSLTEHFYNFASGIIDIPGIVFYLSGSFLFLFLADQVWERRRWN